MKEKAKSKELVDKFMPHTDCAGDGATSSEARQINLNHAKRCALICVDEIIAEYASLHGGLVNAILRTERVVYWQRVRTEIEAL